MYLQKQPCSFLPYFCQNYLSMDNTKQFTALYWVLFVISIVTLVIAYIFAGGYASLVLPFNFTFMAKALDLM